MIVSALAKSASYVGTGMAVIGAAKVHVDSTIALGYDGGIGVLLSLLTKHVGMFRESGSLEA